jgi:hypothetical protein
MQNAEVEPQQPQEQCEEGRPDQQIHGTARSARRAPVCEVPR